MNNDPYFDVPSVDDAPDDEPEPPRDITPREAVVVGNRTIRERLDTALLDRVREAQRLKQ